MSSSEASPSIPFRSKKPLNLTAAKSKALTADLNPLSAKTPEKSPQLPRRSRNSNVALSLKEVRKAAESRRESARYQTTQTVPVRRKIDDFHEGGGGASVKAKIKTGGATKLPEKYEILCEFFNSLDNAIRLVRLKGSAQSFTNICPKIQCFTDRRFTYSHLAQLKFILPEVIEIKRILVFDERTSCMKPDLHINLNLDLLDDCEKTISEGGNIYLRRVFRSRLVEFSKTHPEGHEVPEEALPEPFNIRKQDIGSNLNKVPSVYSPETVLSTHSSDLVADESTLLSETKSEDINQLAVASHLPISFRKHFSHKPQSNEVERSRKSPEPSSLEDPTTDRAIDSVNETPRKDQFTSVLNTPAKSVSTPVRLMSVTPGLCTPKRSYMSPENESNSSPNKLARRPPRTRSLKFDSPMKNDEDLDGKSSQVDNDILDVLPLNLVQSIREKERLTMEERDPAISRAKRRRQMISCLPKLFNMIHFLFQSISRCVITKEELLHKLISSHSDIVDRREVEEQINLLLELVPDWISEKLTSGGDLLLRINKVSSPESIRTRLEEAK